ncbi:hypothetical protein D3C86_1674060 [compost metagenome]
MKAENQWSRCPKRRSPNKKRPKKADSRKKAKAPSMARVWAMIPPAKTENLAQLVPNWNSIGMPVTTPMTKLMAKILAQNRALRFQRSSWVRKKRLLRIRISRARPMVSCG